MPPPQPSPQAALLDRLAGAAQIIRTPSGEFRSTIDPDDFWGGFGVWSGTSFAAPVLAGQLAQAMLDSGYLAAIAPSSCVDRAWDAVSGQVPTLNRP